LLNQFITLSKSGLRALAATSLAVALVGCASDGGASPSDVKDIQAEMKSQAPKDLGTVPPEKATAGVQMAGGKKGGN